MKSSSIACKFVFISPPSLADLEQRLRARGTETEDKIAIRMHNAIDELAYGNGEGNFDAIIVNDDLAAAYDQLLATIQAWYPELSLSLEASEGK